MRRDPTEFRQRFAAWKDGENYWDTRGEDMLPGYSGGKTGFYSTHRDKWKLFLISKGVGAEQADRLSVYFAALDSLESGGGTSSAARQKNNFGGMQRGGKNISYDTVQDYMNDKWNMMNKRFSRALNAKTVQEYATLINDPKYAGKGYLYAVADGYNQKNPLDRTWVARQIQHMNNYTKAMMGIAGLKGFIARPVPKAPVVSRAEPILKANPIPSAVELLKQNELPVVLPEPTVTTTQTPTQAAQQAQLSEYIQKPLVSEKVPVLGGDYWENYFNNNSLDQFQSLIQQLMTSHKHGKNILPRHADSKTPGEYNEELVELPEVRVDNEGNVVQDGRRGSIRLPNLEVIANPIDVGRGEAARILKNAFIESNDATATPHSTNSHLNYKGIKGMTQAAVWMKDNPTLNNAGMALGAAPFAVAGYPAFIAAGEGAATALTNPYVDAALTSGFGAHGLQSLASGEADWSTALEIAPLGRLVKPMFKEAALAVENYRYPHEIFLQKAPKNVFEIKKNKYPTVNWQEAVTPQITAENAASMTPEQWTAAQDAAIARGDMNEAQRLRDLHFVVNAPNTKVNNIVYHGNRTDDSIIGFDPARIGSEHNDVGLNGFWFIDNPEIAKWEYSLKPESYGKGIEGAKFGEVIPSYINLENPAVLQQKGLKMKDSPYGKYPSADESLLELFSRAKTEGKGKDGFIFKLKDADGNADPMYESIQNQFVVRNPSKIKRADAVTFDDNGVRIPLGERDNFNINDIRYGIVPFLGIGGAAYGLSEYKHGKNPIHINPANRGKFNALKKRTGKTTELLTHSKNPLTRKRAIFALNSKKFKH